MAAFAADLDARAPDLMRRYDVPGMSIALVLDGTPVWSAAYGFADVEHRRPMTVDSLCRAESISKSVTAWGVMRLVEQGRLELDAPVERYLRARLPESEFSGNSVTIRRLLSHSAGMPLGTIGVRYDPGGSMPSLHEALSRDAQLVREPGAAFGYSNVGFNLLELVIEEVTGREFSDYMAREVLAPLGMKDSSFAWRESLRSRIPTGYDLRGNSIAPYVYPEKGSGGLFATVDDLARFASADIARSASVRDAVLSKESVRRLQAPEVDHLGLFDFVADAYGFGHFVEKLPDGRKAAWHGGQGRGWMTHFHVVPETGDGIVILTNSQRSWPVMAEILDDWARWRGFGSVKMGRIAFVVFAGRALLAVIVLVAAWQLLRLLRGFRSGTRRWAPPTRRPRAGRLIRAAVGLGALGALGWSAAQPYLFISSVLPGIAGWLWFALLALAVVLIATSLFPRAEPRSPRLSGVPAQPAEIRRAHP